MDVDLTKMTDKLKGDESWDEVTIKRLSYGSKTEYMVARWNTRKNSTTRMYEIVSNSESGFMPAWVQAKRHTRRRMVDKAIVFGIIKYYPSVALTDGDLVGVLVPNTWLLHEFRSDPVRTEGNYAR